MIMLVILNLSDALDERIELGFSVKVYTCSSFADGKFSTDVSRVPPATEHPNPSYSAFVFLSCSLLQSLVS